MGQPRVIEVDYYVLIEKVKDAANSKCLIEKANKQKWREYVQQNSIRETSIAAHGKVKFTNGEPRLVAIDMGSDWDGCYAYSTEDEAALKYIP